MRFDIALYGNVRMLISPMCIVCRASGVTKYKGIRTVSSVVKLRHAARKRFGSTNKRYHIVLAGLTLNDVTKIDAQLFRCMFVPVVFRFGLFIFRCF